MTTTLTKTELVKAFADKRGTTQKDAAEILDQVFETIEATLYEELTGVKLGAIGTLKVEVVPEREHQNPSTGGKVTKPEHYAVKFKANAAFKRDLAEVAVQG